MKGNGPRILGQIASLARVTEEFGEINALAGGSSASISTFLYESIALNPAVRQCATPTGIGTQECTPREKSARMALLLKSIFGYSEIVGQETGLAEVVETINKGPGGPSANSSEAAAAISALLLSDIPPIINSNEIRRMLAPTLPEAEREANLKDIRTAFSSFGNFTVDSNRVFFRVPILNWAGAARLFNRAANFYAGAANAGHYGVADVSGTRAFLDACSEPSRGKLWPETEVLAVNGSTCGAMFTKLLSDWNAKNSGDGGRINDKVGDSLRSFVHSTSIRGASATSYTAALATYEPGGEGDVTAFKPDYKDLFFGYWSRESDKQVVTRLAKYTDTASKRAAAFGSKTWDFVLQRSPAEPGISRLVPNSLTGDTSEYTSGGWGDGLPTRVLKEAGCENIVLITRQDNGPPTFQKDIARELGATDADLNNLFSAEDTASTAHQSLSNASAVWCTNWDGPDLKDQKGLEKAGYTAPLLTVSPAFPAGSFANKTPASAAKVPGCTAGVPAPKSGG